MVVAVESPPRRGHGVLKPTELACAPDHPEDSIEGLNEALFSLYSCFLVLYLYCMKQVVVDGNMVEYRTGGDPVRPAVLLLHGWASSSWAWTELIGVIAEAGYYAVAPEYPEPREAWRLDDYVEIVGKFLDKIDVEPCAVIGHSFGGRIMLKEQYGAKALVFIDSAGIKQKQNYFRSALARAGKTVVPRRLHSKLRRKVGSEDYKALPNDMMRETFKNIIDEDLTPLIPKINLPTLLIWGDEDVATPLRDADIFHKNIKGSQLFVVEGAGHYAHMDNFPVVSARILDFFRSLQNADPKCDFGSAPKGPAALPPKEHE